MLEKISKSILLAFLGGAVILGGYLGYQRFFLETSNRSVELCIDLNDLKKMVTLEKKSLDFVLKEVKKRGITSLGVLEETLPDASALGELYYVKGSGIFPLKLLAFKEIAKTKIHPQQTYLYIPQENTRKRVFQQFSWVLGKENVKFWGKNILEINEAEEEIRSLGIGLSETQLRYLKKKGFRIIPRIGNDPRYHLGNIEAKISIFKDYSPIIFEGEEILGYPQWLLPLASSLKKNKIKYGYLEIVKQEGDTFLRNLMEEEVVRVHSIPKEELKKLTKEETLARLLRAVRERGVRFLYLRPFLPPQIEAFPIDYNLNYLEELKGKLEKAGFILENARAFPKIRVFGWQILILGLGVVMGGIFLLHSLVKFHFLWDYLIIFLAGIMIVFLGTTGKELITQKSLALLASIIFPSLAIISAFSSRKEANKKIFLSAIFIILKIVAISTLGILLLIGLLNDSRFMLGSQNFAGIKIALILPLLITASYFVFCLGEGSFKEKIKNILQTEIPLAAVILGALILLALAIFVARSGNFILPVPKLEKYFRNFLEMILFIRPRIKEFLIGYPLLFWTAIYFLRGKQKWLWLLASLGTIAPVSLFNSFSHVHTPIIISLLRSLNGLIIGLLLGLLISFLLKKFMPS